MRGIVSGAQNAQRASVSRGLLRPVQAQPLRSLSAAVVGLLLACVAPTPVRAQTFGGAGGNFIIDGGAGGSYGSPGATGAGGGGGGVGASGGVGHYSSLGTPSAGGGVGQDGVAGSGDSGSGGGGGATFETTATRPSPSAAT